MMVAVETGIQADVAVWGTCKCIPAELVIYKLVVEETYISIRWRW